MNTNSKSDGITSPSNEEALHTHAGKSTFSIVPEKKRDSGYGTDATVNSPASLSSAVSIQPRFTFGSIDTDVSLNEDLENMDVEDSEEVFADDKPVLRNVPNSDFVCPEQDVDKEVEKLTGNIPLIIRKSEPIAIQRPQAPVPSPEALDVDDDLTRPVWRADDYLGENHLISSPFHHTAWTRRERNRHNRFRPIASRSYGTQTPSPHGQIIRQALVQASRPGRQNLRLRIRTESETSDGSQLPDVIPLTRDRSTSLPAVSYRQQIHEQEVGRELRRISDEFHSSFRPFMRDASDRHASSLPTRVTLSFQATWTRIRRVFSNSDLEHAHPDLPLSPH